MLTLVHPDPGFFTQAHLDLLQSIGDQAGIAINNARLYDSLQVATQRYRELFENNIDPILISDWRGKILEGNRQANRMAGANQPGLMGRSILDLHAPDMEKLGAGLEQPGQRRDGVLRKHFPPAAGRSRGGRDLGLPRPSAG